MRRGALAYDRFAQQPPGAAWAALVCLVLVLAAAVWTAPPPHLVAAPTANGQPTSASSTSAKPPRDRDLVLYERIAERVAAGDNYYVAAVQEQRAGDYPVRPGIAVRLPTLALLAASLGPNGLLALASLLGLGTAGGVVAAPGRGARRGRAARLRHAAARHRRDRRAEAAIHLRARGVGRAAARAGRWIASPGPMARGVAADRAGACDSRACLAVRAAARGDGGLAARLARARGMAGADFVVCRRPRLAPESSFTASLAERSSFAAVAGVSRPRRVDRQRDRFDPAPHAAASAGRAAGVCCRCSAGRGGKAAWGSSTRCFSPATECCS